MLNRIIKILIICILLPFAIVMLLFALGLVFGILDPSIFEPEWGHWYKSHQFIV